MQHFKDFKLFLSYPSFILNIYILYRYRHDYQIVINIIISVLPSYYVEGSSLTIYFLVY